jgi:hypothetical protein
VAQNLWPGSSTQEEILAKLERRLGRVYARQRLGIERDHESIFGHGINFFHPENWYSIHSLIRAALKLAGLYWRGCKNTERIQVRHNDIKLPGLPSLFDGYTILHISDMHADMNPGPMQRLIESLSEVNYDICVLTGDFRGETFVFDEPNSGFLSTNLTPPSIGCEKRLRKTFFAIRGVPFATASRVRSFRITKGCIRAPSTPIVRHCYRNDE